MKYLRRAFIALLLGLAAAGAVADYPLGPTKTASIIVHDSVPGSDPVASIIVHDDTPPPDPVASIIVHDDTATDA